MSKNLVIVESPAKAKTISRFLGSDYKVLASMGHVMDLPKSKMSIDVENDFKPDYVVSEEKKKVVQQLRDELKKAEELWIATDEDREGEAIGWHLLDALKVNTKKTPTHRIVFHEITEGAIKDSLKHPRDINQHIVDAQQARRVLDRLVGYELSPLLWKKIRYGLSAGRVQSVAVRLVVDREREILAFKPEEYWTVIGNFEKKDKSLKDHEKNFQAELQKFQDKKLEIVNGEQAEKVLKDIDGADYKVISVEEKETKRSPAAPFITSTLQQEASRKMGFAVKKTMMVAQRLYEGIDTGSGQTGMITYMRTDSVNLSDFALKAAKEVITKLFGPQYALDEPRKYKGRKSAQEAHEAIRPVDLSMTPDMAAKFLDHDQSRLYELIWKRTVACQMKEAILAKVGADINAFKGASDTGYSFRATGQTVVFPGFMEVYMEGRDHEEEEAQDGEKILPKLVEGEMVDLKDLVNTQHFTKPPARYTEASLVKKLESEGIGRPSTYAPTITTIMTRGYIEKDGKALKPTDVAMVVTDMLVENFHEIVDYKFTAEMEEKLDTIEEGKLEWVPMIRAFYEPFHKKVVEKDETLKKGDMIKDETSEMCEKCGSKMMIKLGRFGKFLSCSNYPECKNAKPLDGASGAPGAAKVMTPEEEKAVEELKAKHADTKCEKCGKPMEIKSGRFGPFLGCSGYPDCKTIVSIVVSSGVKCPKCGEGDLVERHTKRGGKIFWGCNKFPKCKLATWNKPVDKCVKCGGLRVEDKKSGEVKCMDCEMEKRPEYKAKVVAPKGKAKAKPAARAKKAKKEEKSE